MDAGDVELSGAVDFDPDEVSENAEESVETAKTESPIKEEDIRFRADDIRKRDDMFVRVTGGERRKRIAERRKKSEQKQSLREAKKSDCVEQTLASKQVVESEKKLKKEQRRIAKEQRDQIREARRRKITSWAKKHWYVFVAAVVLAIASVIIAGIVADYSAKKAKEKAVIQEKNNFVGDTKDIEKRMWENADGQQPWTAIREYDDLIANLSTNELKANAYISRSRLLLNYIDIYNDTDDKDELIRQVKSDVEKAAEFNVSSRAVCWASRVGKRVGDLDFYEKYTKECSEWKSKNPQSVPAETPSDQKEGEREG